MIDFTHKKRPEFVQLVLIVAVVCLALGAITPAASAAVYDWEFNVTSDDYVPGEPGNLVFSGVLPDGNDINIQYIENLPGRTLSCGFCSKLVNEGIVSVWLTHYFTDKPYVYRVSWDGSSDILTVVSALKAVGWDFWPYTYSYWTSDMNTFDLLFGPEYNHEPITGPPVSGYSGTVGVSVVDSDDDYLISVFGFDGTQLSGSAYTIAVSTFTGGYGLPLTSFPMYLGDSPVHFWTSDQTFTLPVYLSDGLTPIDYYCMLSFPADPTATGYPFWWNLTISGSSGYPFNTTYPPVVYPTPTPLIPSDIIPDPDLLNNTINITGWYQDQGYEGNNITAPIYSGLRGFFTETLIPFYDFFLTPIGSLASMITDSAGTSKDAIYDSVDQLSSYAAPMNMVGGYVVLLVPDVVWVVVFAALTIGYAVLLIRISTGSIRDTINRFLGGR